MKGTIAALAFLATCAQASAEQQVERPRPATAPKGDAAKPGVVEGAFEDSPFVVRSAIAGEAKLGTAVLGRLEPGQHSGYALIILSEDPDECALIRQHRARKNSRYVIVKMADRVGASRLTTRPEGGGERAVGDETESRYASVSLTQRDPHCKTTVLRKAKRGTLQLLGFPAESLWKKDARPEYVAEFEVVFDKGSQKKAKGTFRAPVCTPFSEQLENPAKTPEPMCVGPGEEAPARPENK